MSILSQRLSKIRPGWLPFSINLLLIALITAYAPTERVLGTGVRLVYLHGAWVWTALITFFLAALAGLVALLNRQGHWHSWSLALGRTGMTFWLTYLPMSLLVMQVNWGGLFLDEPRWRIPLAFAVAGLLLQTGLALLPQPGLASLCNMVFGAVLLFSISNIESVMHPDSPVFGSGLGSIQLFYGVLLLLSLLAAVQIFYWWTTINHAR